MNIFLCKNDTAFCKSKQFFSHAVLKRNLKGISVKLSRLRSLGISLEDVLAKSGNLDVLVDAEFTRLDSDLSVIIGNLKETYRSRLLVTVQMKRADAMDQLKNLDELGLRTVITRGNNAYLNKVPLVKNAYVAISHALAQFEGIEMVAGTVELASRIGLTSRLQMQPEFLLELQGYQTLENSSLWIYFNNGFFSEEAFQYLRRRGVHTTTGRFMCSSVDQLNMLLNRHRGYLFIDACCAGRYVSILDNLVKS